MRILAVETSCDETAAAVVEKLEKESFVRVESSVVASQVDLHAKYGGVYPEVASREHIKQILPVIAEALGLPLHAPGRLPPSHFQGIDYLAVTRGPGLIGSLLVGTQTIATLGYATRIPVLPVNHLSGHIYASFIAQNDTLTNIPEFPLMTMIVSGGHTLLVYMPAHHTYQLIGQTRDDAAGEAFDKVAKLLGLPYPGGPQVSELAKKGDRHAYSFPIGLEKEATFDFSFSGLKTAVLRQVQSESTPLSAKIKANIAASFERAVIESLLLKTAKALKAFPVAHFVLGGGVAANWYLRERLGLFLAHQVSPIHFYMPPLALCTDNAAVIGAAAALSGCIPIDPKELHASARFPLATP